MTILHIIEPFASGVTTFIIHLTRELPQHRHIVLHGTRTSVDQVTAVRKRFPDHVDFHIWPHAAREISVNDLKAFTFLYRFLKRESYDVIHLHSSKAGFLGQIACGILRKQAVIYSPHAGAFLRTDVSRRTRRFYLTLEKWAQKLGRAQVVCCSLAEQHAYRKGGFDAICIRNGTEIKEVVKDINPEETLIITSALLKPQKNPELFNRIAERMLEKKNMRFLWIGDGELRNALTSPKIKVTGWLEGGEVDKYYAQAPVYIATSAWEGMPYSVLEAMNAKCILLLTDCGGHQELVEPGKNGFLFKTEEEAAEKLDWLVAHRDGWKQMGNASKLICEGAFSSRKMAEAYEQIYSKCLV